MSIKEPHEKELVMKKCITAVHHFSFVAIKGLCKEASFGMSIYHTEADTQTHSLQITQQASSLGKIEWASEFQPRVLPTKATLPSINKQILNGNDH